MQLHNTTFENGNGWGELANMASDSPRTSSRTPRATSQSPRTPKKSKRRSRNQRNLTKSKNGNSSGNIPAPDYSRLRVYAKNNFLARKDGLRQLKRLVKLLGVGPLLKDAPNAIHLLPKTQDGTVRGVLRCRGPNEGIHIIQRLKDMKRSKWLPGKFAQFFVEASHTVYEGGKKPSLPTLIPGEPLIAETAPIPWVNAVDQQVEGHSPQTSANMKAPVQGMPSTPGQQTGSQQFMPAVNETVYLNTAAALAVDPLIAQQFPQLFGGTQQPQCYWPGQPTQNTGQPAPAAQPMMQMPSTPQMHQAAQVQVPGAAGVAGTPYTNPAATNFDFFYGHLNASWYTTPYNMQSPHSHGAVQPTQGYWPGAVAPNQVPMQNFGGAMPMQTVPGMAPPSTQTPCFWQAQQYNSSSGNESDQQGSAQNSAQSSEDRLLELEARVKLAEARAKNAEELAVYSEKRVEEAEKSHEVTMMMVQEKQLLRQTRAVTSKAVLGTIEGPVTDASCSEATSGPGNTDDECKLEFQAMEKAVLDIVSEENTPPGLSDNVGRKIDRKTVFGRRTGFGRRQRQST